VPFIDPNLSLKDLWVNVIVDYYTTMPGYQEMRSGRGAEEAAYKAGFNDYSNFYRSYKSVFGIMPSDRADKWQEVRLV
jgi:AraC-like DNA-binding protein